MLLPPRHACSAAIIWVHHFMYPQSSSDMIVSLFGQTIKSDSVIPANLMAHVCFLSSVPKTLTDTRTRKASSTGTCQNEVKSRWRCGMQAKLTGEKRSLVENTVNFFPSIYNKEQRIRCRSSSTAVEYSC